MTFAWKSSRVRRRCVIPWLRTLPNAGLFPASVRRAEEQSAHVHALASKYPFTDANVTGWSCHQFVDCTRG